MLARFAFYMAEVVQIRSEAKINLFLNVLGRRPDGYHEIETVMVPVSLSDVLEVALTGSGIEFRTDSTALAEYVNHSPDWWHGLEHTGSMPGQAVSDQCPPHRNLVLRAAAEFFKQTGLRCGVRIRLWKSIPVAGGLGGGSSNAAKILLALNQLTGNPLDYARLLALAARLGSDVPFFLGEGPALATGRGEIITPLPECRVLEGRPVLLLNPGFGVSTPWAYRALAATGDAARGAPAPVARFIELLQQGDLRAAAPFFYNALEKPVLRKYPILEIYQEFLRARGAAVTLMSGSGPTTFAVFEHSDTAERVRAELHDRFGPNLWTAVCEALTGRALAAKYRRAA